MTLQIPITGVPQNFRVPGAYAEIDFAQGPATAEAGVRTIVIVAPMLSSGSFTANTLNPIRSVGDAEAGCGSGSMAHRVANKVITINPNAKVSILPVAETSGGSPVAATATVTFATTPTGVGTATVTVCGIECSYTFDSTDTVTTIAAGIVNAIKDNTILPVTASNSAGVVTITAKLKGASQGDGTTGIIRIRAKITAGVGTTVATSGAFLGSAVAGADGTTTEAANTATALTVIASTREYYIVSSAWDATSIGNLKTHIVNKSLPLQGLRSVGIFGFTGTLSAAQTLAVGRNYERLAMAWQPNSEHDTAELAGALAAVRQAGEQVDAATNFDGFSLDPYILPPFNVADIPDADDQNDAINDGITPISAGPAGAFIVMSVDTRSKNSTGVQDDFRATETHRVSVCDLFTDTLLSLWALQYSGKKIKDDQRLANGSVNVNQKLIRGVVTPSQLVAPIRKQMDDFELLGLLQNTDTTKQTVTVLKTGSRFESSFDLQVIDLAHQATFRIAEVSPG